MTWNVNVSGVWKTLVSPAVNVAGTWHNILQGYVNVGGVWKLFFAAFTGPVVHTYSTAGGFTEVIPLGASNVVIEGWGDPGGGCKGVGTGCAADSGSSGASGGYTRSTYSVVGQGGKTIVGNIGAGGAAGGPTAGSGTGVTISSGTFAITTMTAPGGGGAANPNGGAAGGAGGGGNQASAFGNAGQPSFGSGFGGAGVVGVHGTGPRGGSAGFGAAQPGSPGGPGLAIFWYT